MRTNKKGERIAKTEKVEQLSVTDNAHDLSSGTRIERVYADHSNRMKALANTSRLALLDTPKIVRSPSATKHYAKEVASLNSKLTLAISNRPLERQAQILGTALYRAKLEANPNVDNESKRKFKNQALQEARHRTGATAHQIKFTQEEWNAIQAGAISENKLVQMLQKADIKSVRELATPRNKILMTPTKMVRAQQMADNGYTRAQIADQLGVSLTTLETSLNGG